MDQNYTTMQLAETKLKLNQVLTRIQNDLIYHIYIQFMSGKNRNKGSRVSTSTVYLYCLFSVVYVLHILNRDISSTLAICLFSCG